MLKLILFLMCAFELTTDTVRLRFPILKNEVQDYYLRQAEAGYTLELPRMVGRELIQGQVGYLFDDLGGVGRNASSCKLVTFQIIDEQTAIAKLKMQTIVSYYTGSELGTQARTEIGENETLVLLHGLDTKDLADGQTVKYDGCLIVDGTYQYTTVNGSTKTLPVLKKTEIPQPPKHAAMLGVGVREWRDKSGKHSVEAAYVGYERGKVAMVRKIDGKQIEVELSKLDDDSQEFVRGEIKKKLEAEKEAKQKKVK